MGKGRKPLLEDQEQGICVSCKKNKQMPGPKSKLGYKRYISTCSSCTKKLYNIERFPYRKNKKPQCEHCGFIAKDKCQLDIHHIDRDNTNNSEENLITLCANCHRYEHKDEYKIWASLGNR